MNNTTVAAVQLVNSDELLDNLYLLIQSTKYGIYMLSEATKVNTLSKKPSLKVMKKKSSSSLSIESHLGMTSCGKYKILRSWDLHDIENIKRDSFNGKSFVFSIDVFNMYAPLKYTVNCMNAFDCESFVTTLEILKSKTYSSIDLKLDLSTGAYYEEKKKKKSKDKYPKMKECLSITAREEENKRRVLERVKEREYNEVRLKAVRESFFETERYDVKKRYFEMQEAIRSKDEKKDNNKPKVMSEPREIKPLPVKTETKKYTPKYISIVDETEKEDQLDASYDYLLGGLDNLDSFEEQTSLKKESKSKNKETKKEQRKKKSASDLSSLTTIIGSNNNSNPQVTNTSTTSGKYSDIFELYTTQEENHKRTEQQSNFNDEISCLSGTTIAHHELVNSDGDISDEEMNNLLNDMISQVSAMKNETTTTTTAKQNKTKKNKKKNNNYSTTTLN